MQPTNKTFQKMTTLERFAVRATRWIGSINSLIVHTVLFVLAFLLILVGFNAGTVMLVLTTIVSLEAIYLSIFIQLSVNRNTRRLHEVSKDIEEIQEDVGDIQENVEDLQENVEDISEDVEEIQKGVDDIQEDVGEIQKDVDDIQENVEDISEDIAEEEEEDKKEEEEEDERFDQIEKTLQLLVREIGDLKKKK